MIEKDRISRKINSKKIFVCEIVIFIIILICQKLGSLGPVQQKARLPSCNLNVELISNMNICLAQTLHLVCWWKNFLEQILS